MPAEAEIKPPVPAVPPPPPEPKLAGLDSPEFAASMDKLFPDEAPKPATPEVKPPEKAPEKPAEKAAEKPPEKAAEKDDEDAIPQEVKTQQGQNSWHRMKDNLKKVKEERDGLRTERDQLIGRVAQFEKDLAEAKASKPADVKLDELPEYRTLKSQHEQLTKDLEAYSERLRLVDVEKHPRFEAYFNGKIENVLNIAKNAGGDRAVELLKLPPSDWRNEQIEALAGELGAVKGGLLVNAMARFEEVNAERASEIARARDNYKALKDQEAMTQKQQQEALERTFATTLAEVMSKDKGLAVFQERDGDAEWNNSVRERAALAKRIYNGELTREELARAAVWSAGAPALIAALKGANENYTKEKGAWEAQKAELEKAIAELKAGTPRPGGDPDPAAAAAVEGKGLEGMMADMERKGIFLR